jgi:hypothetical protein
MLKSGNTSQNISD